MFVESHVVLQLIWCARARIPTQIAVLAGIVWVQISTWTEICIAILPLCCHTIASHAPESLTLTLSNPEPCPSSTGYSTVGPC